MKPVRIRPDPRERPWGSKTLQPLFENRERETGEVWFQVSESYPLLVKFLFTSANLSVQVHPDDDYARKHHNGSRGKTEMWHILGAEPGAKIALGFQREITAGELKASALSGDIVHLLNWVPVTAGETYLTPAGTVHAIGAGITLCEIQQNSDITYRLYDWDREPKRELHLDRGVSVSHLGRHPGVSLDAIDCSHFVTDRLNIETTQEYKPRRDELLVICEGSGLIGEEPFRAGEVWHLRKGTESFAIDPVGNTVKLLRTAANLYV